MANPSVSTAAALAQIDEAVKQYKREFRAPAEVTYFNLLAISTIVRIAGQGSVYAQQVQSLTSGNRAFVQFSSPALRGVLNALQFDVEHGYLTTVRELAHADVFADFLEMADYLCSEGYKDAAAVLAGGALESHLRQLCEKNSVDTDFATPDGPKPKKAETMNADLAKSSVYFKLEQKNITAWLDLRNKAAHAKYEEYTVEQVALMLQGVRDFILTHPA